MRASPAHAPTLRQLVSHTPNRLFNELLATHSNMEEKELRLKGKERAWAVLLSLG